MPDNPSTILNSLNELLDLIPIGERVPINERKATRRSGKAMRSLSVDIPAELKDALETYCKVHGEIKTHVVERAVRLFLLIRSNRRVSVDKVIEQPETLDTGATVKKRGTYGGKPIELDW